MTIFRSSVLTYRAQLYGFLCVIPLACSAARLDPNTKAVTFDTPELMTSAEPLRKSTAPSTASLGTSTKPSSTTSPPTAVASQTNASAEKPAALPEAQRLRCSRLPDPKQLVTDDWIELRVKYENGTLSLHESKQERTRRAQSSARKMGRFAAELWIGCELIDRVRFDFPLLDDKTESRPSIASQQPNFEAHGRFEARVMVPNSPRATRLELRDRANESAENSVVTLEWPLASTNAQNGRAPTNHEK